MMASATTSRGRSLTPPSLKNHARPPSMHHLRGPDYYSPYHPPMYPDPAYYRTYGDPYVMQRLPPAPAFAGPSFISPPSSSRSYRHMYSSSDLDRYPSDVLHRRMHEPASMQRSRSRRRYALRPFSSVSFILSAALRLDRHIVVHPFFSSIVVVAAAVFYRSSTNVDRIDRFPFSFFGRQTDSAEYRQLKLNRVTTKMECGGEYRDAFIS